MDIQSSSDLKTRMVGVLWGDSGVGKTTYAGSLPGKKLIVNFDPEGFLSLAHRDDFDLIDLSVENAKSAGDKAQKVGDYIVANADQYESVIVDSLTTLAEMSLNHAIAVGVGKSKTFTPSLLTPGLSAYGGRNNVFNDVISRILRATGQKGLHCFMLAHAADPIQDESGNSIAQSILLADKMRTQTTLKASEIWHITESSKGRTIFLRPFGVKAPMKSRMFSTDQIDRFTLNYDPSKSDEEQPHSLLNIYKTWVEGGKQKLTSI